MVPIKTYKQVLISLGYLPQAPEPIAPPVTSSGPGALDLDRLVQPTADHAGPKAMWQAPQADTLPPKQTILLTASTIGKKTAAQFLVNPLDFHAVPIVTMLLQEYELYGWDEAGRGNNLRPLQTLEEIYDYLEETPILHTPETLKKTLAAQRMNPQRTWVFNLSCLKNNNEVAEHIRDTGKINRAPELRTLQAVETHYCEDELLHFFELTDNSPFHLSAFPKLKSLTLHGCPSLTGFTGQAPGLECLTLYTLPHFKGPLNLHHFPNLKHLEIVNCPQLTLIGEAEQLNILQIDYAEPTSRPLTEASFPALEHFSCRNINEGPLEQNLPFKNLLMLRVNRANTLDTLNLADFPQLRFLSLADNPHVRIQGIEGSNVRNFINFRNPQHPEEHHFARKGADEYQPMKLQAQRQESGSNSPPGVSDTVVAYSPAAEDDGLPLGYHEHSHQILSAQDLAYLADATGHPIPAQQTCIKLKDHFDGVRLRTTRLPSNCHLLAPSHVENEALPLGLAQGTIETTLDNTHWHPCVTEAHTDKVVNAYRANVPLDFTYFQGQCYFRLTEEPEQPIELLLDYTLHEPLRQAQQQTSTLITHPEPLLDEQTQKTLHILIEEHPQLAILHEESIPLRAKTQHLLNHIRNFACARFTDFQHDAPDADFIRSLLAAQKGDCAQRAYLATLFLHYLGVPALQIENNQHALIKLPYKTPSGELIYKTHDLGGANAHYQFNQEAKAQAFLDKTLEKQERAQRAQQASPKQEALWKRRYTDAFTNALALRKIEDIAELRGCHNPLIQLQDGQTPLSIYAAYCTEQLSLSLYVDTPQQLWPLFRTYCIEGNTRHIITGPLGQAMAQNQPLDVVINFTTFKPEHLVAYQSLLDTPPTLFGETLPACINIIGLIDTPTFRQASHAFLSRCTPCAWSTPPKIVHHEGSGSAHNTLTLNLYHNPAWRQILLGQLTLQGASIALAPSEWVAQSDRTHQLHIINPPNDPSFHQFIEQVKIQKRFFYNGQWCDLPATFDIRLHEEPAGEHPANLTLQWADNGVPQAPHVFHVNAHSLHQLTSELTIDENGLAHTDGSWLDAYENTDILYIHQSLPEGAWQRLCDAIARYPEKNVNVHIAPGCEIPGLHEYPMGDRAAHEAPMDIEIPPYQLYLADNPDAAEIVARQLQQDNNAQIFHVTPKTTVQDILLAIQAYENPTGDIHFSYQWGDIPLALLDEENPQHIILVGDVSPALYYELLPWLSANEHVRYNGHWQTRQGTLQLILTNPAADLSHLANPLNDMPPLQRMCVEAPLSEAVSSPEDKESALLQSIEHHRFTYLSGPPAVGKTHTVRQLKEKDGITLYEGLEQLQAWLEDTSENKKILFLDELNLLPPGTLDFLIEQGNGPHGSTSILFQGKIYPLSERHHLVGTGNDDRFIGRHQHTVVEKLAHVIAFEDYSPDFYLDFMAEQLAGNSSGELGNLVLGTLDILRQLNPFAVTDIRALLDFCAQLRLRIAHYPDNDTLELAKGVLLDIYYLSLPPHQRNAFCEYLGQAPQLPHAPIKTEGLYLTPTHQYLKQLITQRLQVRQHCLANNDNNALAQLKKAFLVQGPPGIGKSTLMRHCLESQGLIQGQDFYHINGNTDNAMELIKDAYQLGKILILDESNTKKDIEAHVNDILNNKNHEELGDPHPGFMLLMTQNSMLQAGCLEQSEALYSRVREVYLSDFTNQELTDTITMAGLPAPQCLVDCYHESQEAFPHCNERTLYKVIDICQQQFADEILAAQEPDPTAVLVNASPLPKNAEQPVIDCSLQPAQPKITPAFLEKKPLVSNIQEKGGEGDSQLFFWSVPVQKREKTWTLMDCALAAGKKHNKASTSSKARKAEVAKLILKWQRLNEDGLATEVYRYLKEGDGGWSKNSFKAQLGWHVFNKLGGKGLKDKQARILNEAPINGKKIRHHCNYFWSSSHREQALNQLLRAFAAQFPAARPVAAPALRRSIELV